MKIKKISPEIWREIESILPNYSKSPSGGRPRLNLKSVFEGILFVSDNRWPWKQVPSAFGSGTALNDYFREWAGLGVFHQIKSQFPQFYLLLANLDWEKIEKLYQESESKVLNYKEPSND